MSETMVKLLTFPSVAGAAASYQVRIEPVVLSVWRHPRLFGEYPHTRSTKLANIADLSTRLFQTEQNGRQRVRSPTAIF